MVHQLETIPDGRPGLEHKLRKIRALLEDAKRDPVFRDAAAAIVAEVPERDQRGEVEAVFDFVRSHVRYLRDPWSADGLELFTTPQVLLEQIENGGAIGDCDDHVILAAALLETIGYRTRFRIGGMPPDHYRHIWLEAQTSAGWLPLELTKKDEDFGYDPSHRFPLNLTTDGQTMFQSTGLGAAAPSPRIANMQAMKAARETRQSSHAVQHRRMDLARRIDRATRLNERLPSMIGQRLADEGRTSFRDQMTWQQRSRQQAAARVRPGTRSRVLGDYEVPPSFQNTPQEERWFGYTPSDVWRDDELADDVLGLEGFGKKLRKLTKKTSAIKKKVQKGAVRLATQAGRTMKREFVTHSKMLQSVVRSVAQSGKRSGGDSGGGATTDTSTMYQPLPFQSPFATGLNPPDLYESGGAGGGGAEAADPWTGWDAVTENQEVDSLYTPETADEIGPDLEMPGQGRGSYVPTGEWEDTTNPFSDPATGGEGMDYDRMDVMDPVGIYGDTADDGLGDWLSDLVGQVGSTVLSYQQQKLQAKAAQAGYPQLQFGAQIPPMPTTPVPSVPAQTALPVAPPVSQQDPDEPRPRRAPSGVAKYGPWIMVGVGGLVLFGLMSGVRRRR